MRKKLRSTSIWFSLFILLVFVVSVLNPLHVFAASNIAQGKTASADSSQAANPVASGNDGSTTTRWCAADGNLNHWWKVDLGASYALSGSEVMWEKSGLVYKYKVEVSTDNTNWTLKVDKTANTSTAQTQNDPFTATARYVRITVTGLSTSPVAWASFFEFRVFDTTSGPTATPTRTPTPQAGFQTITNDTVWKDTSGNTIYAQGGGMLKVGNTYYWYGTDFQGAHDTSKSTTFLNIKAYSSTDLKNWTFRANVITQGAPGTPFQGAAWMGRPDVIFNANTQKYVMLLNYEATVNGTGPNGVAFATSSSPTGTFTYAGVQTVIPNVYFDRPGDQSVFVEKRISFSATRTDARMPMLRRSEPQIIFKLTRLLRLLPILLAGWKRTICSNVTACTTILSPRPPAGQVHKLPGRAHPIFSARIQLFR